MKNFKNNTPTNIQDKKNIYKIFIFFLLRGTTHLSQKWKKNPIFEYIAKKESPYSILEMNRSISLLYVIVKDNK